MTNDVHSRIARVRELCEKASAGPWEVLRCPAFPLPGAQASSVAFASDAHTLKHVCNVPARQTNEYDADFDFIAESRTLLPALADDAEKMLGLFGAFLDEVIVDDQRYDDDGYGSQVRTGDGPLATKARALKAEFLEGK